jgi:hypothetical protein
LIRKAGGAVLITLMYIGCGSGGGGDTVRRAVEDDVEVILNPAEPLQLKNKPLVLSLERVFVLDTEDDAIAALGVTDIDTFDVDRAGNILIIVPPTGPRDFVYRLSPSGKLLASFGWIGQGPGEMEYPSEVLANDNEEIWVLESPKNKVHVFDGKGKSLAVRSPVKFETIVPLANGNHLVTRLDTSDLTTKYLPMVIELYDPEFRLLKELDRSASYPNRRIYEKVPEPYVSGIGHIFLAKASRDRVYVGNSERGYEILVFDLEGRLVRKIRKDYSPVPVTEEYKKGYLKDYLDFMPDYAKKIHFPENWHPFHAFFPDEEGRLYVMTYEPGEHTGKYIFDIFNKDGAFVARTALAAIPMRGGGGDVLARFRGDRIYAVEEKESGFKRLSVYRVTWREATAGELPG